MTLQLDLAPIALGGVLYAAKTAVVDVYRLEREGHGILTVNLEFSGPGWGQGLPGVAIDAWDSAAGRRIGTLYGGIFVAELVDRLGSPGTVGQTVVVLKSDYFIDGFCVMKADGSLGEPFLVKAIAELAGISV